MRLLWRSLRAADNCIIQFFMSGSADLLFCDGYNSIYRKTSNVYLYI